MKFKGPLDVTAISVRGLEFAVKDGVVDCPDSAEGDLQEIGFVRLSEAASEPADERVTKKVAK